MTYRMFVFFGLYQNSSFFQFFNQFFAAFVTIHSRVFSRAFSHFAVVFYDDYFFKIMS